MIVRDSARYDVAVIGAGPAGMAAAAQAAETGARVALIDQGLRIGGAYFRHSADHAAATHPGALHHDWSIFEQLQGRLVRGQVLLLMEHTVWSLRRDASDSGFEIHALRGERERAPRVIRAPTVVVATGSHERTTAFPGWTLPGVMTAGAAQSLLKGSLVAPTGRVVLAGGGPLLLVVASGLLDSGVEVAAVVERGHPLRYLLSTRAWPGLAARVTQASELLATLARHRVRYLAGHQVVGASGTAGVTSVDVVGGLLTSRRRTIGCDTLLISDGYTPQVDLLLEAGAASHLDDDGSVVVTVDGRQCTTVAGLYSAGETTGVGGARLAMLEGSVAGAAVAGSGQAAQPFIARRIAVHRAFAQRMHEVHAVDDGWTRRVDDDTVVCRCEEVTAGTLRTACADLGVDSIASAKIVTRAGMGLCQGRICTRMVADLVGGADETALTRAARRAVTFPVPLAVLAGLGYEPDTVSTDEGTNS